MTDKWFSDIGAPGELTLADVCEQIEQKIHANADNQKLPQEFPDWQSCAEDRDATIYKLSAAVVNLCRMVEYLASEQRRFDAALALEVALASQRHSELQHPAIATD
ncbi:MAG: hypothetical protein WBR28_12240 [Mycobacterium sp.]